MNPNTLDQILGIKYPIIMAPMFLISNTKMIKAALDNGITAAFPALNYRTDKELRAAIQDIKSHTDKPFGVNLIVNKSNPKYLGQLETLLELGVAFIITSLGNPKEVIEKAHEKGIKVFCDVVDLKYAQKVEALGADALIAVSSEAGGHVGKIIPKDLITLLKENCNIPIISAGGVALGSDLRQALEWGAAGASVGTIFIACDEADISQEYKQAVVDYGASDIVLTTKMSGSPLTVINTPYVQGIGTEATFWERLMNNNKSLKKYVKMLIAFRGMKQVEKAAKEATYKTVWCAGPAIEHVTSIKPIAQIIQKFTKEFDESKIQSPTFKIEN
ncbi:MAG: nitronate monooxygenase [Cyclobacteriaceae bacterium]|nr:nitronate monooxygenase [Cyclobacteriaceae bacterium]